jgi:predicted MFS family arabinose efflux permease
LPVTDQLRRVGAGVGFWLTAAAFTVTMLGTTLPTPLYPSYEQRFGFGPLTVTVVFATYAVGVLLALLAFGRASDTLGRRPALLTGLTMAGLSSVVFLVVGGVHSGGLALLLVGRLLSGLSAGIFTGTATAALADFAGTDHRLRSSLTAAIANIGGLGLGPLVAGALARYVAKPLTTCFAVHLTLVVIAAAAIAAIPEPVSVTRPRRLTVQRLGVPADLRAIFIQAGTAGFAGFAVLGFFTAVSPATLGLLGHHNPLVTGLVVFAVFAASALGQVASVRPAVRTSLLTGTATLIVGIAGVGIAIGTKSLPLLVAGGVVSGLGQGLSFRSALGSITAASPVDQRAAVSSSFFAVCYVGISLPVVGVGAASNAYGLVHTGEAFAGIIAVLSLAALASLARSGDAAAHPR